MASACTTFIVFIFRKRLKDADFRDVGNLEIEIFFFCYEINHCCIMFLFSFLLRFFFVFTYDLGNNKDIYLFNLIVNSFGIRTNECEQVSVSIISSSFFIYFVRKSVYMSRATFHQSITEK